MTNVHKAIEISEDTMDYQTEFDSKTMIRLQRYNAAMLMAQWKDEQMVRAAKNAFCEVCPYGPCPYPVDNSEECKKRLVFGEKVYNNLQEL